MGVFPSGQWGQTVNLLLSASVVRIHPRPPKNLSVCKCAEVFVLLVRETHKCGWIRTASTRRTVRRVKKPLCNSDDRCQRQNQGGAVGAAASRMRVPPKARCSRWEPRPVLLFSSAARESTVVPQLTISMGDDRVELFVLCPSLMGHAGVRTAPYTSLTTAPISLRMHSARGAISGGSWAGPGLMQT